MRQIAAFAAGYLCLLFISTGLGAPGGNISIESRVDRSTIFIGDVITYSVVIAHDPEVRLLLPALAANLGMFEIRDYKVYDPENADDQVKEKIEYLISTFDTGEYEIPELMIEYTVADDSTIFTIKSEPITVTVESLNPDEAGDIRDIKPPLLPPPNYGTYITYGSILLILIALAILLLYFLKRRRQGKSLLPRKQKPIRPAHEIAMEELERLVAAGLLNRGEVKEYYIQLSDIIRQYIENRFYIPALEMTTGQLITVMSSEGLDEEYIDMMRIFLDQCDLVKFAKYIPTEQENNETTQIAFDFVDRTKLVIHALQAETETAEASIENEHRLVVDETETGQVGERGV
jgi:hypothetical protein